jgi:hypothetical protein
VTISWKTWVRFVLAYATLSGPPIVLAAGAGSDFEADVAPILAKRCLECHNARDANGQLVLTTAQAALAGGESGPVLVPGKPEDSPLLHRVVAGEMPPPRRGKPQTLPESEQKLLRAWIADGANWPAERTLDLFEASNDVRAGRDWWSLRPIRRPAKPPALNVDEFIRERLTAAKLEPAPPAAKSALIRRLFDDLIGLPPTFEQIQAFEGAANPQAYERLVDELLASPQFGVRQARHWLDLVRFAETCGYERDQVKPFAWKYRDWVVNSFNDDKPFDRFVLEQLAGDELPDRTADSVIGTGFLMLGTWNDEPNDPQEYKYERLEDLVHATSSAFLGMTVKCARCHDHKFDPIAQEDYYRMAGVFWPGPIEPRKSELIGGVTADELGVAEVLGWTDIRREPPPLHLLKKGDPRHPLAIVEPAHLSMIPSLARPWEAPAGDAKSAQRRLQLAKWIVDPANPLTARVIVNRLWQQHFGQGLVRSPNDFGFNGLKPTHPELLDALAADLIDHGWTLKRLHKLMVMSQTYQQASVHPRQDEYQQQDAGNSLWWHAERRRRDAESLRDAMLQASGEIDLRLGGPSFKPSVSAEALEGLSRKSGAWQESSPDEQRRRSLYIFSQRSLLPPLMTTFDFPDTTLPCAQRDNTTVAPQALALLNGQFVQDRSTALAQRIQSEPKNADVIAAAWRFAVGRSPADAERSLAENYLAAQQRQFEQWVQSLPATTVPTELPKLESLVLHLRADQGIQTEDGRVTTWRDGSPANHSAAQTDTAKQPLLVADALNGHRAVRFDGTKRGLNLEGQVLTSGAGTIFAVVNDHGPPGHREIFSNWNGAAGNSGTSVFFGLTGENIVRLSDAFVPAGSVADRDQHFLLTGIFNAQEATVFQNARELARKPGGLGPRNLTGQYVIGTQGNLDGEYWNGDIAEVIVFDRSLTDAERKLVSNYLLQRYGLAAPPTPPDPKLLALASLCQVLLNTNEFLYVD